MSGNSSSDARADSLRATAYHEAGHAVMAHLCGQQITRVEIIGDEESSGSCAALRLHEEPGWGDDPALRTAPVEARILCICAGTVAESVATGRDAWNEDSSELDQAVHLAMRVVGDCERVVPYLRTAREHTELLLRDHWLAVEAVAGALLIQRSLSGAEVRSILDRLG